MIFFLFSIILISNILQIYSDPHSQEYTYNYDCPSEDYDYNYCISLKNSSIISSLKQYQSTHNCLFDLNEQIRKTEYTTLDLLTKEKEPKLFGLYTKENIQANQSILRIPFSSIISNKKLDIQNSFISNQENLKDYKDIDFKGTPYDNPEELRFIHNLLIVYYNINDFINKEELLCIDPEIKSPFFTTTFFEQDGLADELINEGLTKRSVWKDIYYYFLKIIANNYNNEQRIKLFGRLTIPFDDFAFVYWVFSDKNIMAYYEKETYYILAPIIMNINPVKSLTKNTQNLKTAIEKENKQIIFNFALKNSINQNEEILRRSPILVELENLLIKGFIHEKNEFNCVPINFLEEKIAKKLNEKEIQCFEENKHDKLKIFYMMINYFNMEGKTKEKCKEFMAYMLSDKQSNKMDFFEKKTIDELIDGKYCKHVKWNKYKLFEKATKEIELKKNGWKSFVKKCDDYISFRKEKGLDFKNAELFKKFYENNLRLLDILEEKLQFFIDYYEERTEDMPNLEKSEL